jgi:hypothetical protein
MKVFLFIIVLLLTSLTPGYPLASPARSKPNNQAAQTCPEALAEVARFKDVFTTWGPAKGGDAWSSSRYTSPAGETFWEGTNSYKSESRFKKIVRQINEDQEGVIARKPIFDDNGREIGQRIVKETRVDGKTTNVLIRRITPRSILGISAPSLELALTVEKARIDCR